MEKKKIELPITLDGRYIFELAADWLSGFTLENVS